MKLDAPAGAVTVADGSVWVAAPFDAILWRIDPKTNRVVETIGTGRGTLEGVVAGEGGLWVVASGS